MFDVGGESTRPGSAPITAREELRRVMPVLESLASEVEVPISIDTYKAEVARRALAAGASAVSPRRRPGRRGWAGAMYGRIRGPDGRHHPRAAPKRGTFAQVLHLLCDGPAD
nr:hypothetical protein [Anaerolineae bacterium]